MSELSAGVAAEEITPSSPQWLDGYGNRSAPSEGVYQAISAKALALEMDGARALLIAAEVLGFDRARVPALKQRIEAATGVPGSSVVLTATHTHCAPRVCDMVMPGSVDPDYVSWFEDRILDAAARACAAAGPVRVSLSRASSCLGINRRVRTEAGVVMRPNPDGPRDDTVETVWLERISPGETEAAAVASLTVAACHPTCRGGQLIGGDYPGYLMRELESTVGGVALFVLGCAGDVRPGFTSASGGFRMAEPEEVRRAGEAMAAGVLRSAASRLPLRPASLRVARREVEMPLADPPSQPALRAVAEADESPLRRRWAKGMLARGADRLPRSVPFEIQAVALWPEVLLLFWPGEVVCDYGLWARSGGAGAPGHVLPIAYANGAVGYVPSESIYPSGGYEVSGSHYYYNLPAPYAPEVDGMLRSATRKLIRDLSAAAE